ncbi:GGDEF domain-containing protein [Alteromonas oceanisediminis]|uniref:GGDEF domain-containing protein n=1 Tax=Alteromonas oceanisediminis TaxID=2836180 RepID=UPI001BD97C7C|nr:GGDEF domain-containing protein [Alteromonas oceanisediminis]MBT0586222.1 GGDEF domain-containing protein [Alteromonas oceanisediminis]
MHLKGFDSHRLLEQISDATVVFDALGQQRYANPAFSRLEPQFQQFLLAAAKTHAGHVDMESNFHDHQQVTPVALDDGFAFVISSQQPQHHVIAEQTLQSLLTAMERDANVYMAAAKAIQQRLGWRWVAITRFSQPTSLEILAFTDHQSALEPFEYDVAGTPCEMVVDSQRFTVFSELQRIFPNYQALKDMGAQAYAGLVYRDAMGNPLGHIMAMHDSTDTDYGIAEQVISIATIVIAPQFKLRSAESQLQTAEALSRTDALTQIGNRLAFDDTIKGLRNSGKLRSNATIAVVDLDHLKPLNDRLGHAAGDRFIQLIANELSALGRESDLAFRLGGDEFAVIFHHYDHQFVERINAAFEQAIVRIQHSLNFHVSASIGFAALQEVEYDIPAWIALADQRMYAAKKSHALATPIPQTLSAGMRS